MVCLVSYLRKKVDVTEIVIFANLLHAHAF